MTNLTPEERILGRENANRAIGMSRRDWLIAAAASPGANRSTLKMSSSRPTQMSAVAKYWTVARSMPRSRSALAPPFSISMAMGGWMFY